MNKPWVKWILGLLDNSPFGMSMRKFLALWIIVLITRIHNKYLQSQLITSSSDWDFGKFLIIADYLVIGLLIGLIVFQDILRFKNGDKTTTSTVEQAITNNTSKTTVTEELKNEKTQP